MKRTTTTSAAPIESERTRKTRENQEKRLARVNALISDKTNPVSRAELIFMLSKAVTRHDSGKIEGIFSLDTACSNNEFCPRMQAAEDPAIICKYCYTKSMWDAARFAHHIVGLILSSVELTDTEAAAIAIPTGFFRFNSDGELINQTHAENLLRIARAHPATSFAIWTKRPALLDAAIRKAGKPDNLLCGVSSPMVNVPFRERWTWTDFIFTVYTPAGMEKALARGEHECNGRKCMICGFHCYQKHSGPGPVYVAEALRKPTGIKKADFPAILAAIDAATL